MEVLYLVPHLTVSPLVEPIGDDAADDRGEDRPADDVLDGQRTRSGGGMRMDGFDSASCRAQLR